MTKTLAKRPTTNAARRLAALEIADGAHLRGDDTERMMETLRRIPGAVLIVFSSEAAATLGA